MTTPSAPAIHIHTIISSIRLTAMDCKEFSLSRFHEVTHALTLSKELKLSTVMAMFDEITLLFSTSSESEHNHVDCLGSALSFATSDVTTKLKHVRNRTNEMIEAGILTGPAENQSIESIMLAEKKMNWHLSGPDGIDKKGSDFQNASRSIVRLVWFLDFVYEMIWDMRENPNDSLQTAVKYSYNKVLGPRHNALIRNAFKVAVFIIPSKATFMEKISNGHTAQRVGELWVECEKDMKTISEKFWAFLQSEGMDELP